MHQHKITVFLTAFLLVLAALPAASFDCAPWVYSEENPAVAELGAEAEDPFKRGLLWEVTSPGGLRSYLFGTIHLSDPRVLATAKIAEEKITETENFAMEVLITPQTANLSAARMFYADEVRLSEQLPAGLFDRATALLEKHGVAAHLADRLKPWAAYMTLAVPPADDGIPLDLYLLGIAKQNQNNLFGVETIDEQLEIFEQLKLSAQVSLLAEAVCNYAENQAQVESMVSLYGHQDLGGLVRMGERYQTPVNTELLERLLFERNGVMAERIKPWLQQGNFFVAVGALHLPGETGLLRTLAEQGFQLRPIQAQQVAE